MVLVSEMLKKLQRFFVCDMIRLIRVNFMLPGFAIGSLIGGQAFRRLGGALSFQMFSAGALIICVLHYLMRPVGQHETMQKSGDASNAAVTNNVEEATPRLQRPEVKYEAIPQEIELKVSVVRPEEANAGATVADNVEKHVASS